MTKQKPKMVFHIEEDHHDYCAMCQNLGEAQFGVKMHRSLPTHTRWVRMNITENGETDERFGVLCSDCLYDAHHSENEDITVLKDGEPWKPNRDKTLFIRNTEIVD